METWHRPELFSSKLTFCSSCGHHQESPNAVVNIIIIPLSAFHRRGQFGYRWKSSTEPRDSFSIENLTSVRLVGHQKESLYAVVKMITIRRSIYRDRRSVWQRNWNSVAECHPDTWKKGNTEKPTLRFVGHQESSYAVWIQFSSFYISLDDVYSKESWHSMSECSADSEKSNIERNLCHRNLPTLHFVVIKSLQTSFRNMVFSRYSIYLQKNLHDSETNLMIDLGTNIELALLTDDNSWVPSLSLVQKKVIKNRQTSSKP